MKSTPSGVLWHLSCFSWGMKKLLLLALLSIFFPIYSSTEEITVLFSAKDEALLTAKVASYVTKIYKRMGDHFDAGEQLIELEAIEFEARLKRAEALVSKQVAFVKAQERLFSEKIISEVDLRAAIAELASLQSELVTARENVESCRVVAPFKGSVVEVSIAPFERTVELTPLIEIISDDILIGKFYLSASKAESLRVGQIVKIKVNDQIVATRVMNISPVVDPANAFVRVFTQYHNQERLLKPGMVGSVERIEETGPENLLFDERIKEDKNE